MATRHLLLVDGDPIRLREMNESLSKAGFVVTIAGAAHEAIDRARALPPQLVLSETELPDMSGFDLCAQFKADPQLRKIAFVFLTVQKSIDLKVRAFALGAIDVIGSPIAIDDLSARIERSLSEVPALQSGVDEESRRPEAWVRLCEQLPPLETVCSIDYELLAERLGEIPDEVNGLLRLFDGVRSLASVVDEADFDDLTALEIISKLHVEGFLVGPGIVRPPRPKRTVQKPPIEQWLGQSAATPKEGAPAATPAPAHIEPLTDVVPLPAPATTRSPVEVLYFAPTPKPPHLATRAAESNADSSDSASPTTDKTTATAWKPPIFGGAAAERFTLPPLDLESTPQAPVVSHIFASSADLKGSAAPSGERAGFSSAPTPIPAAYPPSDADFVKRENSDASVDEKPETIDRRGVKRRSLWETASLVMAVGLAMGIGGVILVLDNEAVPLVKTPAVDPSIPVVEVPPRRPSVEPVPQAPAGEEPALDEEAVVVDTTEALDAGLEVENKDDIIAARPMPILTVAQQAIKQKHFKAAVPLFRKELTTQPNSAAARLGLGIALVFSDTGYLEAISHLQAGLRELPDDPQAWLALGVAFQNLDRNREARAPYEEYLKRAPDSAEANEVRAALRSMR